jgi:hypothetical protein
MKKVKTPAATPVVIGKDMILSFDHENASINKAILINGKVVIAPENQPSDEDDTEVKIFIQNMEDAHSGMSLRKVANNIFKTEKTGMSLATFCISCRVYMGKSCTNLRRSIVNHAKTYPVLSNLIEETHKVTHEKMIDEDEPNAEEISTITALVMLGILVTGLEELMTMQTNPLLEMLKMMRDGGGSSGMPGMPGGRIIRPF